MENLSRRAVLLGGASLLKMNLLAISARGPGWGYAAVTLVTFLVTLGVGLLKVGVPPSPAFPGHPMGGSPDGEGGALALAAGELARQSRGGAGGQAHLVQQIAERGGE